MTTRGLTGNPRSSTLPSGPDVEGRADPQSETRSRAVEWVKHRMSWEPHHPIEKEIYDVAVDWAEQFLSEGKEGSR